MSESTSSRKRRHSRESRGVESPADSTTCSDFGEFALPETKAAKRERNRLIAKNNRERKKEEVRELQESVSFLARKSQALQNELNMRPSFLMNDRHLSVTFDTDFTSTVMSVLETLRSQTRSESTAFYVVNAASHFFPVICASIAFCELTGYSMHEVIGQNCGFLSGEQTSRNERERLNDALQQGQDISSTLLNYRKDGSTFWNTIHLANVCTILPSGELAPYLIVGLHTEVISRKGQLVDFTSADLDNSSFGSGGDYSNKSSHLNASSSHSAGDSSFVAGASTTVGASVGATGNPTTSTQDGLEFYGRAVELNDKEDEHTILQDILSEHQRVLSRNSDVATSAVGVVSAVATLAGASAGEAIEAAHRMSELDLSPHRGLYRCQLNCSQDTINSTTHPRCESALSVLTNNTDGEASHSSLSAHITAGMQALSGFQDHSFDTENGLSSSENRSFNEQNFQSLATIARPQMYVVPSMRITRSNALYTPGKYPAIQGYPNATLRSSNVGHCALELPLQPEAFRTPSPTMCTTKLRRTYFSAVDVVRSMSPESCTNINIDSIQTVPLPVVEQVVNDQENHREHLCTSLPLPSSPISSFQFTPPQHTTSAFRPVRQNSSVDLPTLHHSLNTPSTLNLLLRNGARSVCSGINTSPRAKKVSFDEELASAGIEANFELFLLPPASQNFSSFKTPEIHGRDDSTSVPNENNNATEMNKTYHTELDFDRELTAFNMHHLYASSSTPNALSAGQHLPHPPRTPPPRMKSGASGVVLHRQQQQMQSHKSTPR